MELEEDLLCEIFGSVAAAECVQRQAEDHPFVTADERCKCDRVAIPGAGENRVKVVWHCEGSSHGSLPINW